MRLKTAWRLMSLLVLLLYAVLVFGAVWLLMKNIVVAIILGMTAAGLVYAAWLMVAGNETARKIGKILALAAGFALAGEAIYFLSDQQNRRALIVIVGLTALYLAAFGLLRKKYWLMVRQESEAKGQTAKFKNPYLIINPKAGDGRAIKAHIDELAPKQGITVIMTRPGVDVEVIAREAVAAGADVLGVSGGDGSIGAVAKVALETGLPMVVLPGGTRCHFARDLGLDPKEIVDSLAGFRGVERHIDAGVINGRRLFLNNASFGLYADIVDHPEYRANKRQVSQGVLTDILTGKKEPYDLQFDHEGLTEQRAVQVLVGINRYNTMSLTELGQRERLDEGVLQVTAITILNDQLVGQMLKSMSTANQAQVRGLRQWTDQSFTVSSKSKTLVVGVDGEREVYDAPVTIKVLPGALRIYVPAEGTRSRRKNPLSRKVVRQAWGSAFR
jgi:diacylglycerol kinase family enzyme